MTEWELRKKIESGELASNNGTVMRTLAVAGNDYKYLKLKSLLWCLPEKSAGVHCAAALTIWRTAAICMCGRLKANAMPVFRM